MLLEGLNSFLLESLAPFSLPFLWQMNRHVQSAVLTLIHPDVPTSSAQTPYGQGTDAESLCAVARVCARACVSVCTCIKNIHRWYVVCVCVLLVCCTKTVSVISCQALKTAFTM